MRTLTTLILAAIALASNFASAQTDLYATNVKDFTELTVAGNLNVVYSNSLDSAGIAVYRCEKSVASALTFSNNKNKLKVQVISDTPLPSTPTLYIYSTSLNKAENWGDSTVTVMKNAPTAEFQAKIIGNGIIDVRDIHATEVKASVKAGSGRIVLQGKAQNASYTIMSSGMIEGAELATSNVKCMMWGTGSVECAPADELKIYGMGSGDVFYKGNPNHIKNRAVGVSAIEMLSVGEGQGSDEENADGQEADEENGLGDD
ncbi:MAG: DUF2807 domain-containing protein [Lachnospiraceae bacterium]|nr:DUF2807 domain-containing protein [Lachnospiraceae bacterium]